jgi:hypothetical protein
MQEKAHAGGLVLLSLRKQAFMVTWLESRNPVAAYRRAFPMATAGKVDDAERPGRLLAEYDVQAAIREGGALVVGSDTVELSKVIRRARDLFESSIAEGSHLAGVQVVRLLAQPGRRLTGNAAAQSDAQLMAALAQRLKVQAAPDVVPAATLSTAPEPTVAETGRVSEWRKTGDP